MAGEQIKRSISLSVTDGQVILQEFQRVGRGAEAELNRIGAAAASNNKRLEETAGAAEGMSRRSRAAFSNLGNQFQDVVVQVQGGTDIFRALSQQVPQALDAFAFWAPVLTLVGAGFALVLPLIGRFIESALGSSRAVEDAANSAKAQEAALASLGTQYHVTAENVDKLSVSFGALGKGQQANFEIGIGKALDAELHQSNVAVDALKKQLDSASKYFDTFVGTFANQAKTNAPDFDLSLPKLAHLDSLRQAMEAIAQYKSDGRIDQLLVTLNRIGDEPGGEKVRELAQSISDTANTALIADHNIGLYRAQLALLAGTANEAQRQLINFDAAQKQLTNDVMTRDFTGRAEAIKAAAEAAKKNDPGHAYDIDTAAQGELLKLKRELDTIAKTDTNTRIAVHLDIDNQDVTNLHNKLDEAGKQTTQGFKQQIETIKSVGADLLSRGQTSQAAINQLVQEAVEKHNQVLASQKKQTEEQQLIRAGVARTKEEADRLLSSTTDRYAGLQGIAKLDAEIADKRKAEAALTGPGESEHRSALEEQINQLLGQRNDLLQKQEEKLAAIDKSNKNVLDSLDAALAKSASKDITQDVIDTAGQAARNRIKMPTPEEVNQPGGAALFDKAKLDADLAYAKGAAAEYDKFFTNADADIAKADEKVAAARERALGITDKLISPQERYNDEVAKLAPLLDGNVEDQMRYNKAIDELNRRLPILQHEYEIRKKNQQIQELEQSKNPADWAEAGFLRIEGEAEDAGKEVSGAFKTGFDQVNHGFFEMISGQKQGWADVKQAALSFVDTLGEVALKQFEIMAINQAIGFVASFAGGASGNVAPVQTAAGYSVNSSSIMAAYDTGFPTLHSGGRVGEAGAMKYVDPAMFNEAPRFHGGGSLAPRERPIIARDDERVLTGAQNRDWENGLNRPVMIKQEIHNSYSGIYDMQQLQAVTDMSAQKSHAQMARAIRSDPNIRRQIGRS